MAQARSFCLPNAICIVFLITFLQSVYTSPDLQKTFLSTRGVECASPCEMKNEKYYWCSLVTRGWDYCSINPSMDHKGRKCEDKCDRRGKKYEWCKTENSDWGYCSQEGHQVLVKHFGSFEDKECTSTCAQHGKSYYWCRMADSKWDYCSPKQGRNSAGTMCKNECAKTQDTKYQWCFDDNEKWQYCSRVTTKAVPYNHVVSPPNVNQRESGRSSTYEKSSNRSVSDGPKGRYFDFN